MAPRGHRGGRGRGRGRGAPAFRGRGHTAIHATRPGPPTDSGIKKTQAPRKRPIQPRVAATLESAVTINQHALTPPPASAHDIANTTTEVTCTPPPRVHRIQREGFMCSHDSLFFLHLLEPGWLHSTPDTETIALNLIDYFLQPGNFIPELWYSHLHATCFTLASSVTGLGNDIRVICAAVEMQAAGLAVMGYEDLGVDVGTVKKGYFEVLCKLKEESRGLVGEYVGGLEAAAEWVRRAGPGFWNDGEGAGGGDVPVRAAQVESEQQLVVSEGGGEGDLVEDDAVDFDTFDESEAA